ncbi:MAG: nicotinate phosphoribosyltransferase, partial [Actinomycetota bacterium]
MTGHTRRGGLRTDLYELRMVESYVGRDMTAPATFSLYIRPTPERPWFVALGVHRVLELLATFGYDADELDYLRSIGLRDDTLDWLSSYEFTGEVWAVDDGTVVLANEPILEVTAGLPVAQLIETAVINLVQFPTLIATKGARVAAAAGGRPVVDFGFRRAHGLATGVEASLAAHVGGGLSTSNLEAGRRYGLPVLGTMAHSFVQAFPTEVEAFRAYAKDHPDGTTLLVDTYDTVEGVRNAIVVAGELRSRGARLRGIRLDSGDLDELSRIARRMLDDAGYPDVQILASGGLDEFTIAALVDGGAPIDAYGVGTDLVVSTDRPAVDIAYKLVEYDGRPVAKLSPGKETYPGAKQVFRSGSPSHDVLALRSETLPGTPLLSPVWRHGDAPGDFDLAAARERASAGVAELPEDWTRPSYGSPTPVPGVSDALSELSRKVRSYP